jgi:hypothetical protein
MSGGLWQRPTQTELLIAKLRERRDEGKALELLEIMRLGVAQHGARLSELRSRGFVIENELRRDSTGRVLSRYRFRFDSERRDDVSL